MDTQAELKPVGDNVPKVDGTIAVGEDLEFQRRWWKFEKVVWSFFVLLLIADLAGALGRGPLANAKRETADGTLQVKYERIQRENTSSIMTLLPGQAAVHDGKLQLFVSDSILKEFGAQRIIPQPETSVVGAGGVTYTFPATSTPMTVQFELKPSFIGLHPFTIGVPGDEPVQAKAFVLP
ncbi:MAG TPA: hypothetical protein VKV02_07720 [Acidobacteriaceae bacterium]|nr:hypothetical protein [Acidobacteriaceae bacterium]